ncbi:organic solute transporter alpha-like protein [Schistocerca serialis cubense]|uniref:organic solute transporter alpha-like protein n=1 Tax=Schistocerca serialis cubense TaxID=2023355 RepID=UPI00214EF6CE|nr:organic solute transporter alpha-like protein [Schistocerca serialis cubense]
MSRDFQSVSEVAWSVRRDSLLESPTDNDTDCAHSQLPSVKDYYTELSPVLVWVIAVSTVAVLSTCAVYVMSLWHVLTRAAPTLKSPTSYVLTIHPVAAVASYISVLIPRTYFLMEALVQDLFTICVYQMFCLLAAYYEQEGVSRKLRGACIRLSTGPCCCLPCCRRLCTPVPLTRSAMMKLRILVLQLPVVLWVLYGVCYVLWAEDEKLLDAAQPFLVPLQVGSVLLAGWGTNMAAHVLSEALGGVRATHKFLALELTVLLPEVQSLLAHRVAGLFPCTVPFTPIFWSNMVVNVLTLLEVFALSLWARSLYCHQELGFHRMREEEGEDEEHCQEMVDISNARGLR